MTTEDKLKDLILSQYHSFREFTIVSDIPYSTFDSILRRGVANSTVTSVLKICKTLHISADALAHGEIVKITTEVTDVPNITLDVGVILENTRNQLLAVDNLTFNGRVIDQSSIDSILGTLEVSIELLKRKYE